MNNNRNQKTDFYLNVQRKEFKMNGINYYNEILKLKDLDDPTNLIESIKVYMQILGRGITSTQLRNIFELFSDCTEKRQFTLTKPRLAYIGARQSRRESKDLIELLSNLITDMKEEQIDSIKMFTESLVAYHKYFNPKA
jgi:CRISPR type III-A-associated protein Csm2